MNKVNRWLRRSSPAILSGLSGVGLIATTVLAVRATPKALDMLRRAEKEKQEELTRLEIVRTAGPLYIPAIGMGVATLTCIVATHALSRKQQASLTSAYALLHQTHRQYREAVDDIFGKGSDEKVLVKMAEKRYITADGRMTHDPDTDAEEREVLFYDSYSQRYFTSTMPSVVNAQYHLNRNYILRGYATVNEFYDFLGIGKIEGGDEIGWGSDYVDDGIAWLDFENCYVRMDDGLECYIISVMWDPKLLA